MKRIFAILFMLSSYSLIAQNNTNLGTGTQSTGGTGLTAVGYDAGKQTGSVSEINSTYNSFFGFRAGMRHTDFGSNNNTFIGVESGGNQSPSQKSTSNNTFIGYRSGYSIHNGSGQNVFLGANAGYSLTTGSGNLFIGYNAGYNETGSNKLYIDNSNTATPLIYGDFSTNQVGINVLPNSFTLNVGGPINATGLYVNGTAVALGVTAVSPWTLNGTAVNYNNGNVGIGILSNAPAYKLDVNGTINATGFLLNGAPLSTSQWTTAGSVIYYNGGNVGIGTTTPGSYKLNVWGSLRAHEIVVNTTGADFVFEDDYILRPLEEVEKFIKEHKHLPEIPSAKQMQEEGMKMSDTQTKLLQKVEELTLYMIELKKELERVKKDNERLEAKLNK